MHLHVLVIVCTLSKSMIAARDFAHIWPLSGVGPEMIAEVVSFPKYRISELAFRVVALPHLHPPPGGGIDEAVRTKRREREALAVRTSWAIRLGHHRPDIHGYLGQRGHVLEDLTLASQSLCLDCEVAIFPCHHLRRRRYPLFAIRKCSLSVMYLELLLQILVQI
jgi:hypothetical protein